MKQDRYARMLARKYPDDELSEADRKLVESIRESKVASGELVAAMKRRGFAGSRKGSPPISLQTLIERTMPKKAEVSVEEALDAAKVLERTPGRRARAEKYRDAALVGGTLSPVVRGIGRAAEGFAAAARGARFAGAVRGVKTLKPGETTRHIIEGALSGGGIRAIQEGVEVGHAKKKVHAFLDKSAAKPKRLLPLGPLQEKDEEFDIEEKSASSAAVGKFKGKATDNALNPPGKAVSSIAVNPRRSLGSAISAFKS